MSAGMMRVATMVEARSNAPRADRPHHLHAAFAQVSRSFWQAVVMKKTDVETSNRGCGSVTRTHSPRVVSVDM